MAWSGGSFTRTNGTYSGASVWQSDASAAIDIEADRHDTHDKDLADGINNCLTKDATNSPTAHAQWVNTNYYGAAAGSSGNYTLALSPAATAYYSGMKVAFKANHACGAGATLNVNSLGAKTLKTLNGLAIPASGIINGQLCEAVYDGTDFLLLSSLNSTSVTWTNAATGSGSMSWSTTGTASSEYFVTSWPQVYVHLAIAGTTSGTASNYIRLDVPVGLASTEAGGSLIATVNDSTKVVGMCDIDQSSGKIDIYKGDRSNFSLTTGVNLVVKGFLKAA